MQAIDSNVTAVNSKPQIPYEIQVTTKKNSDFQNLLNVKSINQSPILLIRQVLLKPDLHG